ncbi:MAG: PPOX class F420-dependent oxidoreductase [Dehalococcoidia bacterium]
MDLSQALEFAAARQQGVLVTLQRNGHPQVSNILYVLSDDGRFQISVTDTRAKTRNLRRDSRLSLYVPGDTFWEWVVIEGSAELTAVAASPGDATVEELVAYYRRLAGEHPDWEDYRRAMVADKRMIIRVRPERAYGQMAG